MKKSVKHSKKIAAVREGSKQERAIAAFRKAKKGLTIAALSKIVKQPAVTVRSLLGVLRAKGFKIESLGDQTFALRH